MIDLALFDAFVKLEWEMRKLDNALMRYALRRDSTVAEAERIGTLRRKLREATARLEELCV
jgi:hypothetical protein